MEIQKIIGSRVKEFRKKRNLTQEELASMSNLHITFIAHIERGKKVCSIKSLQKIANALKIPVYLLLKEEKNTKDEIIYDELTKKIIHLIKDKSDKEKNLYLNIISSVSKTNEK